MSNWLWGFQKLFGEIVCQSLGEISNNFGQTMFLVAEKSFHMWERKNIKDSAPKQKHILSTKNMLFTSRLYKLRTYSTGWVKKTDTLVVGKFLGFLGI